MFRFANRPMIPFMGRNRDQAKVRAIPLRGRAIRHVAPYIAIAAAALLAYLPSIDGVFVYDDLSNIVDNPGIRQLWPPAPWLDASRRPLVAFTFALNHAIGGLDPFGYHVFNLAVHICVAMALFSLIARSCVLAGMAREGGRSVGFATALLFAVHPLATQGVTYTVQRSESMMALFYVLTLLCLARSAGARRAWLWLALSALCGAAGMSSKAVMVTAPVAAIVYDRLFIAGTYGRALRARWGYYASLLAGGSILIFWDVVEGIIEPPPEFVATVGFSYEGVSPIEYLLAQGGVILYYLRLVAWPTGLRIDYHWPVPSFIEALPAVVLVGAMVAVSFWFALFKRRAWAFAPFAFFLVLSPTSSFIPIKHVAFEHRMYLPLSCALVAAVLGVRLALQRFVESGRLVHSLTVAFAVALSVPLGVATYQRNGEYADPVSLWAENVVLEPDSASAHTNYANSLRESGRLEEALRHYRAAVELDPGDADRWARVGLLASDLGRHGLAVDALTRSVELIDARVAGAHPDLARVLARDQRFIRTSHAGALLRAGERASAKAAFARAIEADSDAVPSDERATALSALASLHQTDGEFARAIPLYEEAVENAPLNAEYHARLGRCYAEVGRLDAARASLRRALGLDPSYERARRVLEAITHR